MRELLEGAGNLADAALGVLVRPAWCGIVVDDRAQDERVVRIQPERDLFVPRQLVHFAVCQLSDVGIEPAAVALERAVVDLAAADVGVENEVERTERDGRCLRMWQRDGDQRKRRDDEVVPGSSRSGRGFRQTRRESHGSSTIPDASGSSRGRN